MVPIQALQLSVGDLSFDVLLSYIEGMWNWRKRREKDLPPPLEGAPKHLRVKTYSAETGYVYQYVFRGYRTQADGTRSDFIFDVSRDRKQTFAITVQLSKANLTACEERIGRELFTPERYALTKMALFSAFDAIEDFSRFAEPLNVTAEFMETALRILGRID